MRQGDVQLPKQRIDQRAHLTQGQREELGKVAPVGRPLEQHQPWVHYLGQFSIIFLGLGVFDCIPPHR